MPTHATAKHPNWSGNGNKCPVMRATRRDYEKLVEYWKHRMPGASPGQIDERIYKEQR